MSDFCCRTFFVPAVPDPAGLYGAICAAVPPEAAYTRRILEQNYFFTSVKSASTTSSSLLPFCLGASC